MKKRILLCLVVLLPAGAPAVQAAACDGGYSGGFACSHVELVAQLTPAQLGGAGEAFNDIWGWVDVASGGTEYAIVGMQNGTAFVRLHGPAGAPEYLGGLAASDGDANVPKPSSARAESMCHDDCAGNSAWRDIKVYDHYAYIVSEAAEHGVQVFDLHELRTMSGATPQNVLRDGYYGGIGHAHNIFINEDSARAYVVGHRRTDAGIAGGLHILDLSAPTNPQFIGEVNDDGYTHDVQCVVYDTGPDPHVAPGSEICFASNEDTLTVWDVTDAANPVMLSRTGYSASGYTHQGWLSEDRRYFFLNDELDEQHTGSRTHLRVFDVSDVDAPELAADYFAPTLAIDHNNYVHGRWLLQSNYLAGLRILDVLDPLHPVEAAYLDNQPADAAAFQGTWSNYLFPSGLVANTDMDDGLFVVYPTLSDAGIAPDLTVSLALSATAADAGETLDADVTVTNGAAAAASEVLLTVHLPTAAEFTALDAPAGWICDAPSRVVQCRIALLDAGAQAAFGLTLTATAAGDMEAIAMAYAREVDAAPADNLDNATASISGPPPGGGGDSGGGGAWLWLLPLLFVLRWRDLQPRRDDR